MEIKKIILALALFSSSLTANALEFLGFKLDNATHQEIHQLLTNNGASLKNKKPLSSVYIVKGNKIPNASWIKTYFNDEDKFIGLQIGFPYQKTSTLPMRREKQIRLKDVLQAIIAALQVSVVKNAPAVCVLRYINSC